jgi:hypothetical protein
MVGHFQRMFADARAGKFDLLLFWSLDRLSREGVAATLGHLERLTSYGVGWRSHTEEYLDSTGLFKDAVIAILATIAKQERIRRSERATAAVARLRRQGLADRLGRKKKLVGAKLERIRELHAEGLSLRAIGSRFSHESLLINYPFFKIICNRSFHMLANLILPLRMRDSSNNLKLFRAEILKAIEIEQPHFAANAETGLKPLLAGYRIKEGPISWINRTAAMGSSSFRIAKVAPNYFITLLKMAWRSWRRREHLIQANAAGAQNGGGESINT